MVKLKSGVSGYAGSGGAALQVKVHRAQGAGPRISSSRVEPAALPSYPPRASPGHSTARAAIKFKAGPQPLSRRNAAPSHAPHRSAAHACRGTSVS